MARRPLVLAAVALVCLLAGRWAPLSWPDLPWSGPALAEVRYVLAWDTRGLSPVDGGGWSVVNDLGYRVVVARGHLVSYSIQLLECDDVARRSERGLGPWSFDVGARVWAGHPPGRPDPAAWTVPRAEDLSAPTDVEVGRLAPAASRYCRAHYLVARAHPRTEALPAGVDLVGTSLWLEGTWTAPGSGWSEPFGVRTSAANGRIAELDAVLDTGATGARVVLRRSLGRLFDGVDFARDAPRVVERRLLRHLVDDLVVEIVPDGGGGVDG